MKRNIINGPSRGRPTRHRLVQKYGLCNISLVNVPKQHQKYFRDIFTTAVEMKWRWCFLFFSLLFVFSWSLFALIYYTLLLFHGDFYHLDVIHKTLLNSQRINEPTPGPHEDNTIVMTANSSVSKPCLGNVRSFVDVFIFSFTTQSTVGYGHSYPTDECPLVLLAMSVQWVCGLISQTLMAGVIFAKLARPIKRAATILFSKNAVICMRDGKLCLLFRVGDMRKSLLAEAHIRLQMIKKCITAEGELLPFHQFDMNVGYDTGLDRVFVIWPITICHEIDASSPLYEFSKDELASAHFEIIVILEGVVESVGSTTQARTSYLPDEILWGKRFEKLVTYQRHNGVYKIDFEKFHNVCDVSMPVCSAKELDQMRAGSKRSSQMHVPPFNIYDTNNSTPNANVVLKIYDANDEKENFIDDSISTNHSHRNSSELQPPLLDPQLQQTIGYNFNDKRPSFMLSLAAKKHHRLILESSDDERFEPDTEREATSVLMRPESPESKQRRKVSFQIRRGPDLF